MTQDLFLTKEQQLADFCKSTGFFSKVDIMQYGLQNFYIRADRTVRDFVSQGKVRRLDTDEKTFRGFKAKCAVYEWVGE
mgnify:CR=1 FL=1